MLYEEWKSRYKNLKNFNTVLQRCPRFWPLAPPRGTNPGVYSLGISEDPPRYLSSKFDASVRSDCWDISIWKTLTQCDGNGNANANANDRGDYNSSPCTSYRRANKKDMLWCKNNMYILTHFSRDTPKRVIGKQCRPRSDAAEHGIWSGSTLFALNKGISIKHSYNRN